MRVIILGSAAGGGVPQWNCGCPNCRAARERGVGSLQSSVAVSADGARWILLNASPDLRAQLAAHPVLWPPRQDSRGTPIGAVVLTDGEIDHTLGLLLLREATSRLVVYAAAGVTALLGAEWPVYRILSAYAGVDARTLLDGTFWSDGELRDAGVEAPTAREMGHLPIGDPGGSIEALPNVGSKRVVLVHINNTNPILREGSAERLKVEAAGIEVGEDGME